MAVIKEFYSRTKTITAFQGWLTYVSKVSGLVLTKQWCVL